MQSPSRHPSIARASRALKLRPAVHAALLVAAAALLSPRVAPAAESWRGLDIPDYPQASNIHVESDADEYEIYFHSEDAVQAVFDFYRAALERQGFAVKDSKQTRRGHKARLVRGAGGPENTIELDAKPKHGRYKVEIEFDE
ncbi:MAG: hypothetical protein J0H15_06015 [Xanthomonadales bacterium]|nr:hypothetical protein [Xanthomonadales bacterium]